MSVPDNRGPEIYPPRPGPILGPQLPIPPVYATPLPQTPIPQPIPIPISSYSAHSIPHRNSGYFGPDLSFQQQTLPVQAQTALPHPAHSRSATSASFPLRASSPHHSHHHHHRSDHPHHHHHRSRTFSDSSHNHSHLHPGYHRNISETLDREHHRERDLERERNLDLDLDRERYLDTRQQRKRNHSIHHPHHLGDHHRSLSEGVYPGHNHRGGSDIDINILDRDRRQRQESRRRVEEDLRRPEDLPGYSGGPQRRGSFS